LNKTACLLVHLLLLHQRPDSLAVKPLMRLVNAQKFFGYLCPAYFICDP